MNRLSCILLLIVGTASGALADDPSPQKEPASLDAQLLDDLDNELLEGLAPPAEPQAPSGQPPGAVGEDIGAPDIAGDDENPLTRIEQKMRQVEQRLSRRDSSAGTQELQREIAEELSALLKQLQKQQQQNQNQNQNNQSQQQQQQSEAQKKQNENQASKSNPSNQPASKPARESEERTGKTDEKIKPEDLAELFQRAWGNLPPQVRARMDAAAQEQFLPKYETLIEDYFKRLAEEPK